MRLLRESFLCLVLVMIDLDVPRRGYLGCVDSGHGDLDMGIWGYGERSTRPSEDDEEKILFWAPTLRGGHGN